MKAFCITFFWVLHSSLSIIYDSRYCFIRIRDFLNQFESEIIQNLHPNLFSFFLFLLEHPKC